MQIGGQELYFFRLKNSRQISRGNRFIPHFKIEDDITRTKMSESTQIFSGLILTTKCTNVPSFAKIRQKEMHDDILTVVIRFMGGLLPHFFVVEIKGEDETLENLNFILKLSRPSFANLVKKLYGSSAAKSLDIGYLYSS